jgi:CDP-diacylglycerol--serine O-phosphatidyltransferase
VNLLANLLTGLSLFFGFVSIIFSLESHFTFASWAIILSVVFDGLDGQVARLNPVPSAFGKELDSLVDVVAFGIAPSVLGYRFVYQEFHYWPTLALFLYLIASVMRLAKYNITPKESLADSFLGLPTTMAGGILASFILIYRRYSLKTPPPRAFFIALVLVLAYLMVSKVRYINLDGLKKLLQTDKRFALGILLMIAAVMAGFYLATAVFLPELIVFTLFVIYLLFSPFMVKSLSHKG